MRTTQMTPRPGRWARIRARAAKPGSIAFPLALGLLTVGCPGEFGGLGLESPDAGTSDAGDDDAATHDAPAYDGAVADAAARDSAPAGRDASAPDATSGDASTSPDGATPLDAAGDRS